MLSRRYLSSVQGLASPTFWRFFLSLHTQPVVAIDAALKAAKTTFLRDENSRANTTFMSSKRTLLSRMSKITPKFWPAVTHTVRFDLSDFNITKAMEFRFINPIWAWIMTARGLNPNDLVWTPHQQVDPVSGERLYGGGVQYGRTFETACQSCPLGTYPMALSLHWDGTNAHGMYATPIAIGVANTNGQGAKSHTCIAYMPTFSQGRQFDLTEKARDIRHYIRQTCIAAILGVLEEGARRGVRCSLIVSGL